MTALRQKQPRVEHPAYLAYVRTLPCIVSRRPPPSDAAHLRSPALAYGKDKTGMQEKPHDWWTLPLNHELHMQQHDRGDELAWWAEQGIPDPFALAVALYASRPAMAPPREPKPRPTPKRKPPSQRGKVGQSRKMVSAGKPIPQRVNPWPSGRKLPSRRQEQERTGR